MAIPGWLIFLAIGAVAGWLAGLLMRGGGFGLLGDIVVASSVPSSAATCSDFWASAPAAV